MAQGSIVIVMAPAVGIDHPALGARAVVGVAAAAIGIGNRVLAIGRIWGERARAGIGRALIDVVILRRGFDEALEAPATPAATATTPIAPGGGRHVGDGAEVTHGLAQAPPQQPMPQPQAEAGAAPAVITATAATNPEII